jgi:hypothetical protein
MFMQMTVSQVTGHEILPTTAIAPITRLLQWHLPQSKYTCTFEDTVFSFSGHYSPLKDQWISLAKNKFDKDIAIALMQTDDIAGCVFVFPRISDRRSFTRDLIHEVLAELFPALYPYHEGSLWVTRPEYELRPVHELLLTIEEAKLDAERKISELQEAVEKERATTEFIKTLLTGTGKPLVNAVKATLEFLGFADVKDADARAVSNSLGEDLQIYHGNTVLLVEIKGIAGGPSDEDSLAVAKYYAPFMKREKLLDVSGLSIINHQKAIPPLEREQRPFREEVIDKAEHDQIGLMTTWQLYKIVRGAIRNRWTAEQVTPLFFKKPLIDVAPKHYKYIGKIERYIEKLDVIGIQLEAGEIHPGDTISYELEIDFVEEEISSLEISNQSVATGHAGSLVGLKTKLSKSQIQQVRRVFKVESD